MYLVRLQLLDSKSQTVIKTVDSELGDLGEIDELYSDLRDQIDSDREVMAKHHTSFPGEFSPLGK